MSWRSQRSAEAGGLPGWREALLPLKQELQSHGRADAATLQTTISTLVATPSSWTAYAAEKQVAHDLALLAQQLAADGPDTSQQTHSDFTAYVQARTSYCRLFTTAFQQRQRGTQLQGQSAATVCAALCSWAERTQGACSGDEQQLQHGALAALGAVLPDSIELLPSRERAACLALLTSTVQWACRSPSAAPTQQPAGSCASKAAQLSAAALGALCVRAGAGALTSSEVASILQCLVESLSAACGSNRRPPEDSQHARYLATLLRSLAAAIAESKRAWVPHTGAIVEALRRLLTYCAVPAAVSPVAAGAPAAPGNDAQAAAAAGTAVGAPSQLAAAQPTEAPAATGSTGRYRPPHARSTQQQQQASPSNGSATTSSTSASPQARRSSKAYSDDSEASDWESSSSTGSTASLDRCRGSRVRLALLGCLQAMIQADSKVLHPHWTSQMPLHQPLQARPLSPTLITVILHDPLPKVRSMAAATLAALLEGAPQRLYMAVAEARTVQRPTVRGFTTLSTSLGHMVASVHAGLLHAVAREPSMPVLAVVLRALAVLCSAAPYERLPAGLLPDVVRAVRIKLQQYGAADTAASGEEGAVVSAALACIAQALSTKVPSARLEAYLQHEAQLAQPAAATTATAADPGAAAAAAAEHANTADPAAVPSSGPQQEMPSIAPRLQGLSLSWRNRGSPHSDVTQQPPPPLIEQLLDFASCGVPLLRIEALAALRGCCVHYPAVLPATHWPRICTAMRVSLAATRVVARSPRGSSSSIGSLPSSPQQQRGSQGRLGAGGSSGSDAAASASTSPEDKAAQHAVKLLGDFLGALSLQLGDSECSIADTNGCAMASATITDSSSSAVQHAACSGAAVVTHSDLASMWQQALQLLLPDASQHASYMIRSAALGVLSSIGPDQLPALPREMQQGLVSALIDATQSDPVPAVRCAACKVLGGPALLVQQEARPLLARTLAAAASDGTATVRIAAAWALANLCDTLRLDVAVSVSPTPAGSAADASTSGRGERRMQQQQQQQQQQTSTPLPSAELSVLCNATLAACQDSDKVRANGVRALGNLMAAWQPCWAAGRGTAATAGAGGAAAVSGDAGSSEWLGHGIGALQSSLATGNMKVQWNACYAIGGLLQNEALLQVPEVRARVDALLLALTMLVRDSSNFKIRTHAAAALAAPAGRHAYGHIFPDAVLVVSAALEAMETGAPPPCPGATPSSVSIVAGASTSAAPAASAASVGHLSSANGADALGDGDDPRFPNFKYAVGLTAQLSRTLLRLLCLVSPSDAQRLREPLSRRLDFIACVLQQQAAAAASATMQQQQEQEAATASTSGANPRPSRSSGGGSSGTASLLPRDPFGLGLGGGAAGDDSQMIVSAATIGDVGTMAQSAACALLTLLQCRPAHAPSTAVNAGKQAGMPVLQALASGCPAEHTM